MEHGTLERTVSEQLCVSGEHTYPSYESISVAKLPFELFLCAEKGGFTVFFGEKEYKVTEGCAVLIPYDTEYRLDAFIGTRICYAAVELCVYHNLRIFSLFELPTLFSGDDGLEICSICREICRLSSEREFTNSRLENAVKLNSDVYRLCSVVLGQSFPKATRGDIMARHEKLSRVLMYIGEHITENIMQAELSDLLSMSPDSFYRLFKNLTGISPKDYIISEKLRAAREMLATTNMPIGEISSIMGYENQLYFSSLFKKKYGVCPTDYKKAVSRIV